MKKLIKNGKVAVLYSPGFGAGWYSWNTEHEGLLFDKEIVEVVLVGDRAAAAAIAERKYPGCYTGGAKDLAVVWLDVGQQFYIHEYDGAEGVVTADRRYLVV